MTTASGIITKAQSSQTAPARLAWVDHLRTLMIVLVINMHACVTFSHVGGWYVMVQPPPPPASQLVFLLWQAHLQSFFMGLLFFVSGYFAHQSLARRGAGGFLRERARRLGLPSLLYMFVLHPFIVYVLLGHPHVPDKPSLATLYGRYLASGRVLSGNGPLWFALALLFFSTLLAGWRAFHHGNARPTCSASAPPRAGVLVLCAAGIALVTFLVRIVQPIGTNVLNFQLCFFTQYIAAFAAGVCAGRRGWLMTLASSDTAKVAGLIGLIFGPVALPALDVAGGQPPNDGPNPYAGGWNLPALALAGWEQFTGLSLGLGLLSLFSRRLNSQRLVADWLSKRSFGVYVLHPPVLVALTPITSSIHAGPIERAALLTVFGIAGSYIAADMFRRIPGLRSIL